MIYKSSLSDVIKSFMTVTIMKSKGTNRFHSNNAEIINIKKCKRIFFINFVVQTFRKCIGFTSNQKIRTELQVLQFYPEI